MQGSSSKSRTDSRNPNDWKSQKPDFQCDTSSSQPSKNAQPPEIQSGSDNWQLVFGELVAKTTTDNKPESIVLPKDAPDEVVSFLKDFIEAPKADHHKLLDEFISGRGDESELHGAIEYGLRCQQLEVPYTMEDVAETVGEIRWLWPDWIPYGMITLVIAEPGAGKSSFVLGSIAKAVVCKGEFLDSGKGLQESYPVIWCDTESSQMITIDRLKKWNLPLDRFFLLQEENLGSINLLDCDDLERLEIMIRSHHVPLVVIDSLRGAHNGEENSSELSATLNGLAEIARDTGAAIVVVHHTRKLGDDEEISANSSRGSNTITAMVRSIIALDKPDKSSQTIRVQCVKSNIALTQPPLGFMITANGIDPCTAPEQHSADIATPRPQRPREKAKCFLDELLAEGPVAATTIKKAAEKARISAATLNRAKDDLGISSSKEGDHWSWSLPEEDGRESSQS